MSTAAAETGERPAGITGGIVGGRMRGLHVLARWGMSAALPVAVCVAALGSPALAAGDPVSPQTVVKLSRQQLRQAVWATEAAPYLVNATAEYDAAVSYVAHEVVSWNGADWVCSEATQGNEPASGSRYWTALPHELSQSARIALLEFANLVEERGGVLVPGGRLGHGAVTFLEDLDADLGKIPASATPQPPLLSSAAEALEVERDVVEAVPVVAKKNEESSAITETEGRELQSVAGELARTTLARVDTPHFSPDWYREAGYLVLEPQKALTEAAADAEADPGFEAFVDSYPVDLAPEGVPGAGASMSQLETLAQKDEKEFEEDVADRRSALEAELQQKFPDLSTTGGLYKEIKEVAKFQNGNYFEPTVQNIEEAEQAGAAGTAEANLGSTVAVKMAEQQQGYSDTSAAEDMSKFSKGTTDIMNFALDCVSLSPVGLHKLAGWHVISNMDIEILAGLQEKGKSGKHELRSFETGLLLNLAIQGPQLLLNLATLIKEEEQAEAIITKQLANIEEMIAHMTEDVEESFASVDSTLSGIVKAVDKDTELLNALSESDVELSSDMAQVEASLDQLEANMFEIAASQRQEAFQAALNTDIGYRTRSPEEEPLPASEFEHAAALFLTWGLNDPFNAISENPERNWVTSPEEVAAELETSGVTGSGYENALNFNLDFLLNFADGAGWLKPAAPPKVGNPEVWAGGAAALSQLVEENPVYVGTALLTNLTDVKSVGQQLQESLEIAGSTTGAATPTKEALKYYEETLGAETSDRASPTTADAHSVLGSLEREENHVLSEDREGEEADPECSPCRLGEEPTGENLGRPLINVWSANPDQAPERPPALPALGVTTTGTEFEPNVPTFSASARGQERGYISKCSDFRQETELEKYAVPLKAAAAVPLPNVYSNAWHLGLGKIVTCYEALSEETVPDTEYFVYTYAFKWYWESEPTDRKTLIQTMIIPVQVNEIYSDGFVCDDIGDCTTEYSYKPVCGEAGLENAVPLLLRFWNDGQFSKEDYLTGVGNFFTGACEVKSGWEVAHARGAATLTLSEVISHVFEEVEGDCGAEGCSKITVVEGYNPKELVNEGLCERAKNNCFESVVIPVAPATVDDRPGFPEGLISETRAVLERIREAVANEVAPEADKGTGELTEAEGARAAARVLAGARAVTDDYVELGLPGSMESDAGLRNVVVGSSHLVENGAPAHELYGYFRKIAAGSSNPSEDPVAPPSLYRPTSDTPARGVSVIHLAQASQKGFVDGAHVELTEVTPGVVGIATNVNYTVVDSHESEFELESGGHVAEVASDSSSALEPASTMLELAPGALWEEGAARVEELKAALVRDAPSGAPAQVDSIVGGTLARLYLTEVALSGRSFAPENLGPPEIAGSPQIGSQLLCTEGHWRSGRQPLFTFRWLLEGSEVGHGQTYVVPRSDGGHSLACVVTARTSDGQTEAMSPAVQIPPPSPAPIVETLAATEVGQRSATLHAVVDPNGLEVTKCVFEYGPTEAYGEEAKCQPAPGEGASEVAVSAVVKGLNPFTRYHFRIYAKNQSGTSFYHSEGGDEAFRTEAEAVPIVTAAEPHAVGKRGATLEGMVNPEGEAITKCEFAYEQVIGSIETLEAPCAGTLPNGGTMPVGVSVVVSGLTPGTQYRYRLEAVSASGRGETIEPAEFSTLESAPPSVETRPATNVGKKSATFNGTVNPNGTATHCEFEYKTTPSTEWKRIACKQKPGEGESPVPVSAPAAGLNPGTRYEVRLAAANDEGESGEPSVPIMFATQGRGSVELELNGKPLTVNSEVELAGSGAQGSGLSLVLPTVDGELIECDAGELYGTVTRTGSVTEVLIEEGEFEGTSGSPPFTCEDPDIHMDVAVYANLPWRLALRAGGANRIFWELGSANSDESTEFEVGYGSNSVGQTICPYAVPDGRVVEGESTDGFSTLDFKAQLNYNGQPPLNNCDSGAPAPANGALEMKSEGEALHAEIK